MLDIHVINERIKIQQLQSKLKQISGGRYIKYNTRYNIYIL